MHRETKIDLGSLNIASYLDERFILVVSTSVTLHLPEQYASTVRTATDLRDHVKQGLLWAARASSCKIDLHLHFKAFAGSRKGLEDALLAAFEHCPVSPFSLLLQQAQKLISVGMGNTWASPPSRKDTECNRVGIWNVSYISSTARLGAFHFIHSRRCALRIYIHMALRILDRLQDSLYGHNRNRNCDSTGLVQNHYSKASPKKTEKIRCAKTALGTVHGSEAEPTFGFQEEDCTDTDLARSRNSHRRTRIFFISHATSERET